MADGDPVDTGQSPAGEQAQPPANTFTIDDNFLSSLPDDLKAEPSLQTFKGKGAADVLKSYVNAQRMIGGEKVVIPTGKNDTPEAWDAFYARLGRPEDPEKYEFEQMPEGLPVSPEFQKSVKALAHGMGLHPKQAAALNKAVTGWLGETFKAHNESQQKAMEAAETALRTEWGNGYDKNLELAGKVIDTYGGKPEEIQAFKEKFGSDPVAIKVLANLGNLIGEGNFIKGEAPAFLSTPEQAKSKAQAIMTDKANPLYDPYHDKFHIRHNEAVEEVERLYRVAYGTEPVDKR
jgi:hypothetical protein